jgi:hypothetical protein
MRVLVVGTGDDGTTPCALLHGRDGRRLLINASEGLQRLSAEHRLKLHRGLDAVLLTSLSPSAVAGLPGLLLSLAHSGTERIAVLGPPGVDGYIRSLRFFARFEPLAIQTVELDGGATLTWSAGGLDSQGGACSGKSERCASSVAGCAGGSASGVHVYLLPMDGAGSTVRVHAACAEGLAERLAGRAAAPSQGSCCCRPMAEMGRPPSKRRRVADPSGQGAQIVGDGSGSCGQASCEGEPSIDAGQGSSDASAALEAGAAARGRRDVQYASHGDRSGGSDKDSRSSSDSSSEDSAGGGSVAGSASGQNASDVGSSGDSMPSSGSDTASDDSDDSEAHSSPPGAACAVDETMSLFEELVSTGGGRGMSALLVRRATTDPALRARLVRQWVATEAGAAAASRRRRGASAAAVRTASQQAADSEDPSAAGAAGVTGRAASARASSHGASAQDGAGVGPHGSCRSSPEATQPSSAVGASAQVASRAIFRDAPLVLTRGSWADHISLPPAHTAAPTGGPRAAPAGPPVPASLPPEIGGDAGVGMWLHQANGMAMAATERAGDTTGERATGAADDSTVGDLRTTCLSYLIEWGGASILFCAPSTQAQLQALRCHPLLCGISTRAINASGPRTDATGTSHSCPSCSGTVFSPHPDQAIQHDTPLLPSPPALHCGCECSVGTKSGASHAACSLQSSAPAPTHLAIGKDRASGCPPAAPAPPCLNACLDLPSWRCGATASAIRLAIHAVPTELASAPAYAAWLGQLGPRVRNVLLSTDPLPLHAAPHIAFGGASEQQAVLGLLVGRRFFPRQGGAEGGEEGGLADGLEGRGSSGAPSGGAHVAADGGAGDRAPATLCDQGVPGHGVAAMRLSPGAAALPAALWRVPPIAAFEILSGHGDGGHKVDGCVAGAAGWGASVGGCDLCHPQGWGEGSCHGSGQCVAPAAEADAAEAAVACAAEVGYHAMGQFVRLDLSGCAMPRLMSTIEAELRELLDSPGDEAWPPPAQAHTPAQEYYTPLPQPAPTNCAQAALQPGHPPRSGPRPPPPAASPPPPACISRGGRRKLLACFLGTGCAVPSKHRAPAAIYLHMFESGGVMLDAGEGSVGQLVRLFGPKGESAAGSTCEGCSTPHP